MTQAGNGAWKQVFTADGSWTLEHPVHGTGCHARHGGWLEARERFAAPARLAELAKVRSSVRLLDIGTGLGLNIAAALEVTRAAGVPLEVVTFENSLEVLERAIEIGSSEPSTSALSGSESSVENHRLVLAAIRTALTSDQDTANFGEDAALGSLRLRLGDARELLPLLPGERDFDAIFLDPFPARKDPDLWQPSFLLVVAGRLAEGGWISTHSAAIPLRASLVAAGLAVGLGPLVGKKAAGTIARRGEPLPALDSRIEELVKAAALKLIETNNLG
ncbi:MAG: tRNA U34 5-methylaminomethyl-2-thiouridine-forming methyltransferase MnmC [Planctomycetota bacterium]|jgi:tRNA U34 5-methylaminomethyl-2-thiouridine-forming methyltransferase MnmC